MTRWLAGIFSRSGHDDVSRLAGALAPHPSTLVVHGPLRVAYSGPTGDAREPLCLLDGYLDNAAELCATLGAPPGSSSEELLALGWRRWGRQLPARLRGDFALLVWDREREAGLLARDQLGVRSMFLHDTAEGLCFASEIRHLLALLPRRPAPDPVSLAHWLTMGNRPGAATLYAGIRRLNPGSMLLLDRAGAHEARYWAPRFSEPLRGSEADVAQAMRAALDRAVQRRIGSIGHTGVLMSGGLDSASVAAVAATAAPGRVAAYSAAFPEHPAVDESDLIDELRGTLDLPGITAEVRPGGLLASALETIAAWDVPLRSWGDFWAQPLLRAAAAAGAEVMLGGDGGDELFGPRSYLLADRLRGGHPLQAFGLVRELPGAGDHPPRRDIARMIGSMALVGALPYGLHEPLRRARAGRDAPSWLLRGRPATCSIPATRSHGSAWTVPAGGRTSPTASRGGSRRAASSSSSAGARARPACKPAIRCSISTWWSSACASHPWRPSTAIATARSCAQACRGCFPTPCGCVRGRPSSTR